MLNHFQLSALRPKIIGKSYEINSPNESWQISKWLEFWTMLSFLLMKAVWLFAFLKQKEGQNDTLLILIEIWSLANRAFELSC